MTSNNPSAADPQSRPGAAPGDPPLQPSIINLHERLFSAAARFFRAQDATLGTLELTDLRFTFEEVKYRNTTPKEAQPLSLKETEFQNNTDAAASEEFEDTQTTTVSTEISVTRGLEVGGGFKFEIPKVGLGINLDVKASVTTTERRTVTTDQSWAWRVIVPVPPRSRVNAQAMLERALFDVEFSAAVRISGGRFSCTASGTLTEHPFVLSFSPGHWFTVSPMPGFTPDGNDVLVQVEGTLKDVQGLRVMVVASQSSLDDAQPVQSLGAGGSPSAQVSGGH